MAGRPSSREQQRPGHMIPVPAEGLAAVGSLQPGLHPASSWQPPVNSTGPSGLPTNSFCPS